VSFRRKEARKEAPKKRQERPMSGRLQAAFCAGLLGLLLVAASPSGQLVGGAHCLAAERRELVGEALAALLEPQTSRGTDSAYQEEQVEAAPLPVSAPFPEFRKLKLLLRRLFETPASQRQSPSGEAEVAEGQAAPNAYQRQPSLGPMSSGRIQTRSVPSELASSELPPNSLLNNWLQTAIIETGGLKRSSSPGRRESTRLAAQPLEGALNWGPSTGHKSTRDIQPVLMRLPPRFGRRVY